MKKESSGTLYIKADNPDVYKYFTAESIKRYNPERAGWIKAEIETVAPNEVIDFMKKKPETVEVKKDFSLMPTRELEKIAADLSDDELRAIIENDKRVTARKIAEKQLNARP